MKNRIALRIYCFLLCLLLLCTGLAVGIGAEPPTPPDTRVAKAVVLYHINRSSTVLASNENSILPAASTVKVLSGLLFCELLESRRAETVTVRREMIAGTTGHRLGLAEGDTLTIEELLYAAICASYNDAFCVLACTAAQSVEGFVARMHTRASELGLEKSVFTDPVGTADSSLTTAAELAKIAAAAYQNPLYMQICSTKHYQISSLSKSIKNRNEMIVASETTRHYNANCNGMSVGSTAMGGDCIVTSVSNGTDSYICVVLGCPESEKAADNLAYSLSNTITKWVYQTYRQIEIISPDTVVCKIPVTVSDMITEVEVKTDQTYTAYLPATSEIGTDITYSIRLSQTELEAPVKEGALVGYVAILYQGEILQTVPLYTAGSAERSGFVSSLKSIRDLFEDRRVIAGLIFFCASLTVWITFELLYTRYKHRRWDKYFSQKVDTTKRR